MCGLASGQAFNGKLLNTKRMDSLALANEARGTHATGFYSPANGIIKNNISASKFIFENEFVADTTFLYHTRYATTGLNTQRNAHPFKYESIILIHNGMISNFKEAATELNITDLEVDSETIPAMIYQQGIDNLHKLEGAMAICWVDYSDPVETLYVQRRTNPLYKGTVVGEGIYLSSLRESLVAIGCTDIEFLPEHTVISYVGYYNSSLVA
jgi:glucosamine 6-phosphate synthetase-like amidotransferase/phosphosugar isomerase protein